MATTRVTIAVAGAVTAMAVVVAMTLAETAKSRARGTEGRTWAQESPLLPGDAVGSGVGDGSMHISSELDASPE